jgi:FAD/FMN-containing dehydrogenase
MFPRGRHVTIRTRWLADLSAPVRSTLIEHGTALPSPFSAISQHHLHGAAARVSVADTAFGLRTPHFMSEIVAIWPAGEPGAAHEQWAWRTSAALAPHALPGGYPNLLGPGAADQILDAYGPNTARLLRIKETYDPDRVFTATPLPGTAPVKA